MEKVMAIFSMLKIMGIDAMGWLVKAAKSKTMLFATLLTVFGAIEASLGMFQDILGQHYGIVVSVIGVIVGLLRMVTTDPLSKK